MLISPSENRALPLATDFPSVELLSMLGVTLVWWFAEFGVFTFRLPDRGLGGMLPNRVSPRGG